MYSAIRANKRNTVIIMMVFLLLIGGLGALAGYLYDDYFITGIVLFIAIIYALIEYFADVRYPGSRFSVKKAFFELVQHFEVGFEHSAGGFVDEENLVTLRQHIDRGSTLEQIPVLLNVCERDGVKRAHCGGVEACRLLKAAFPYQSVVDPLTEFAGGKLGEGGQQEFRRFAFPLLDVAHENACERMGLA